jgi:hypothetical protein
MIWLGAYFQVRHWAIHLAHFSAFEYLFESVWWCPDGPRIIKNMKTCFLVVLDHFSSKNVPNKLARDSFLSLVIKPYILTTCGLLSTILGPFGGAQRASKWQKTA